MRRFFRGAARAPGRVVVQVMWKGGTRGPVEKPVPAEAGGAAVVVPPWIPVPAEADGAPWLASVCSLFQCRGLVAAFSPITGRSALVRRGGFGLSSPPTFRSRQSLVAEAMLRWCVRSSALLCSVWPKPRRALRVGIGVSVPRRPKPIWLDAPRQGHMDSVSGSVGELCPRFAPEVASSFQEPG